MPAMDQTVQPLQEGSWSFSSRAVALVDKILPNSQTAHAASSNLMLSNLVSFNYITVQITTLSSQL